MPITPLPTDWADGDTMHGSDIDAMNARINDELNDELWLARAQGREIADWRTNYRTKPNATGLTVTEDTGQTVGITGSPTPKIIGGLATIDAVGAWYRYFNAGAPITTLGSRFVFSGAGSKTTTGGAVALVIANQSVAIQDTALRFGLHVVINPKQWFIQKMTNATGTPVFTQLASGYFGNQLACDGVTEYEVRVFHIPGTSVGYVLLPDGQRIPIVDTDLATWAGNWGFIECSMTALTDFVPAFAESWADADVQVIPSADPVYEFVGARGLAAFASINTAQAVVAAAGPGAAVAGLSIAVPYRGRSISVRAWLGLATSTASETLIAQLVRASDGAVVQQVNASFVSGPLNYVQVPLLEYEIPAGSPADTYSIRAYAPSGTGFINNDNVQAFIKAVVE